MYKGEECPTQHFDKPFASMHIGFVFAKNASLHIPPCKLECEIKERTTCARQSFENLTVAQSVVATKFFFTF